jgi:hypothetical protein
MPADRTKLINLAMAGTAGLFHYDAAGLSLADLLQPDFFDPCGSMLRAKDVILAVGDFGVVPLRVAREEKRRITADTSTVFLSPAVAEDGLPAA